jgi:hypothetical protein
MLGPIIIPMAGRGGGASGEALGWGIISVCLFLAWAGIGIWLTEKFYKLDVGFLIIWMLVPLFLIGVRLVI